MTFAPGMVGQAFGFDGVDDYVDLGNNSSLNIPGSLTISAWVLIQSFPPSQDYFTADFDFSGTISQGSLGILFTNKFFWYQSHTDTTPQHVVGATVLSTDRWYHVAGVRDDNAKTVKLYVNGSEDGNGNYAGKTVVNLQRNKLLGRSGPEFGDYFHGLPDEVQIYNRALSAQEIAAIFNAGSAGKCRVADADGDGVPDDEDQCPNSDLSTTVVIDGCDSRVPNTLFPTGCTIADLVNDALTTGGEEALEELLEDLEDQGILTEDQAEAIEDCAEDDDDDD